VTIYSQEKVGAIAAAGAVFSDTPVKCSLCATLAYESKATRCITAPVISLGIGELRLEKI